MGLAEQSAMKKVEKIVWQKPCKAEKVAQNETFPILLFDEHKKNDLQNEMKISEN